MNTTHTTRNTGFTGDLHKCRISHQVVQPIEISYPHCLEYLCVLINVNNFEVILPVFGSSALDVYILYLLSFFFSRIVVNHFCVVTTGVYVSLFTHLCLYPNRAEIVVMFH